MPPTNACHDISSQFEKCCKAFHLVHELSCIPEQPPHTITDTFAVVHRSHRKEGDDIRLIQAVISLLKRSLACLDHTIAETGLEKLRVDVLHFIRQSPEMSSEVRRENHSLDIKLSYLSEFLLDAAFKAKTIAKRVLRDKQTQSCHHPYFPQELLGKKGFALTADDMVKCCLLRDSLYFTHKFLLHLLRYQKSQFSYATALASLDENIGWTVQPSDNQETLFEVQANCGHLLENIELLSVRLRVEQALRNYSIKKAPREQLLKQIGFLVSLREQGSTEATLVNSCFALLRCRDRTLGSHHLKGISSLREELINWDMAFDDSPAHHRACDPLFADTLEAGLNARVVLTTEELADRFFSIKAKESFEQNAHDKILAINLFQTEERSTLWSMARSLFERYILKRAQSLDLYRTLTQKMRMTLSRIPKERRNRKEENVITSLVIPQRGERKPRAYTDLSFEHFKDMMDEIAAFDMPLRTKADELIYIAEQVFQDKKAEKLAKRTEKLSVAKKPLPSKVGKTEKKPPKPMPSVPLTEVHSSPFVYALRVSRWWDVHGPHDPFLNDPKYMERPFLPETKAWIYMEHNFALILDQYAKREGIAYKSQLSLVGEIAMGGEKRRGIFTYAFDTNDTCYHRWFTEVATDQIVSDYAKKGFYELDFPALGGEMKETEEAKSVSDDLSRVEKITEHVIVVSDPKNQAVITICRFTD